MEPGNGDIQKASPAEVQSPPLEPIGEIILGKVDPRKMSQDEYEKSPDLLFHGASSDFDFSQNFDYENFDNPHSHTVGSGLYLTGDRVDAELYSEAFGRKGEKVVYSFLPNNARMHDFRSKQDSSRNAHVTDEMFKEYSTYVQNFVSSKFKNFVPNFDERPLSRETVSHMSFNNYLSELRLMEKAGKPVDLRKMLSLIGDPSASEFAAFLFPRFMKHKGFDGIVYLEGGDHPLHWKRHPTSYVFYNLDKVGTYKAWQRQKVSATS